jgi:uncharacterized OB-fold protein
VAETTGRAPLPRPWPDTEFYWTSGKDGLWRFLHCTDCGHIVHPPVPLCPACGSTHTEVRPVSGSATVWSYSIVRQPFITWLEVPYVLAIVAPAEDPGVHVTTRLVGCEPEQVRIGMSVHVTFEQHDDVFLPVFTLDEQGSQG